MDTTPGKGKRSATPEKCRLCAKNLSAKEAQEQQGCWVFTNPAKNSPCHSRRRYWNNKQTINRDRKQQRRKKAGLVEMPPISVVGAVLYVYRKNKEAGVHAWYAELWQGNSIIAYTEPEHCIGITEALLANRMLQALAQFSKQSNQKVECFREIVERSPQQCPIRSCPIHSETLNEIDDAIKVELRPLQTHGNHTD